MSRNTRTYESAQSDRPHPDKGHDRSVLVEASGSFAVFDGAGDAQASGLAARIFRRHSARRQAPALAETFSDIQEGIRRMHPYFVARAAIRNVRERPMGQDRRSAVKNMLDRHERIGLTTGTAVRLEEPEAEGPGHITFAHAGDSSLYIFDRTAGRLDRLTEDEGKSDDFLTDTANFLGSGYHVLRQAGRLALPPEATIALLTDGVNGAGWQNGLDDAALGGILSERVDASIKAAELVTASPMTDDVSAIIIEYRA